MTTFPLLALNIADEIYLKSVKKELQILLDYELLSELSGELFYKSKRGHFVLISNFGVVVFGNGDVTDNKDVLDLIKNYCRNISDKPLKETYKILLSDTMQFEFDQLKLPEISDLAVKIVMFNLAQSVALDGYFRDAEAMLVDIRGFATNLEKSGRLNISQINMRKFLGRALTTKNNVVEHLYVFDDPEMVWDDAYLDVVNTGLVKFFNLRARHRELESTLKVIEDNLSVLMDLTHQKESSRLEWIIILLILSEILFFYFLTF